MTHPHAPDMTETQLIPIEPLQSSSRLYRSLAACASAHTVDAAREAVELALGLAAVAFTSTEIAVAGVAVDAAQRKLDAMLEVAV